MSTSSEMYFRYGVSIEKQIAEFRKRAGENGDLGFETVTEDLHLVFRKDFFDLNKKDRKGISLENVIQSAGWRKLISSVDDKVLSVYYKENHPLFKKDNGINKGDVMCIPPDSEYKGKIHCYSFFTIVYDLHDDSKKIDVQRQVELFRYAGVYSYFWTCVDYVIDDSTIEPLHDFWWGCKPIGLNLADDLSREEWTQIMKDDLIEFLETQKKRREIPDDIYDIAKSFDEKDIKEMLMDRNNFELTRKVGSLIENYEKAEDEDKHIPSIALLGSAGVGKNTFAKGLAEKFGATLVIKTPSDLKGAYVGQTKASIFDLFKGIKKDYENDNDKKPRILLIDEVYGLMGDEFGREAVSILLPIMSGDTDTIERGKEYKDDEDTDKSTTLKIADTHCTIWIAGYELPTRQMLQNNLGLYRRLEVLSLRTPTVDRMIEVLMKDIEGGNITEDQKQMLKGFIAWATMPEYTVYFANYAGVKKITAQINAGKKIENIISEYKKEIEAQYRAAVLMSEEERRKAAVLIPLFKSASDFDEVEVIGYDSLKGRMNQIVDQLFKKDEYCKKGIDISKGILFVGPPGTGKSHMAKYMAWKLQDTYRTYENKDRRIGFIPVVATELSNPDKVDRLFEAAKEYDDCIIFIDEIDAIAKRREENQFSPAMIRLMTEMDGFGSSSGILVLAATNAPESLDPAMKRPGRFDSILEIDLPEMADRKDLIRFYLEKKEAYKEVAEKQAKEPKEESKEDPIDEPIEESIKDPIEKLIEEIGKQTVGCSAVEIKTIINNAALKLDNRELGNQQLSLDDWQEELIEQIDTLLIGEKGELTDNREFDPQKNEGESATAIHEVGHALVSILEYPEERPFVEITIMPRGDALGYVKHDSSNNHAQTKEKLLKDVRVSLGGRIAEELFYGPDNVSAGAISDIRKATLIVQRMVEEYGMSDVVGPMAIVATEHTYLGGHRNYICTDEMRTIAEKEEQRILKEQYQITLKMLQEEKKMIEDMARKVFDEKTMSGDEFTEYYKNHISSVRG